MLPAPHSPLRRSALALRGLIIALAVCVTSAAWSARVAWPDAPVSLQVQDESLRDFLTSLGAVTETPILVSSGVEGVISGRFEGAPQVIFDRVIKAYGLLTYFDGAALHVSASNEIESRSVKVSSEAVDRAIELLVSRDLVDPRQSVDVDRSSGTIRLRGAPEFVAEAEALLRTVNKRASPRGAAAPVPEKQTRNPDELVFRTFKLRYASAADVVLYQNGRDVTVPGVASLLRTMIGDGQQSVASTRYFNQPPDATVPKLRGQGLRRNNAELQDVVNRGTEPVSRTESPRSIPSGQSGLIRIVAEPNLNAVVVRDRANAMPLYESLVAELDVEPTLVEIQVTIVDIDKNKLQDLGVDWSFQSDRTSARLGGGRVERQNGGLILNTVLGDSGRFFARINALAEDGSAEITSRPQVLTLSNLEAVLANDESFYVRVAGTEDVDLFNVTVGTSLRVLPNVVGSAEDPQIRLLVTIEDGAIDPSASVDGIPVVERSSLNTQAVIYDGESLLLGGLVQDSSSVVKTQVPLLGSVPGIGRLFQRKRTIASRTERLFLISPRLVVPRRSAAGLPPPTAPTAAGPHGQSLAGRGAQSLQESERYVEGF